MRFETVPVSGELHLIGGEGAVVRSDLRAAKDMLTERFAHSARVVYIDPPFNTGGSFEFRRGKKLSAYSDSLPREEYLGLMREAMLLSKALLKEDGTFFLHIDCRMSARLKLIADEVFGEDAFTNEIIWAYRSGGRSRRSFASKHDTILMYRMSPDSYFDLEAVGKPRGAKRRNHMKKGFDETGRVYYSIKTNGREYRYYEDDLVYPSDVWDDIEHLHQRDPERTGFITQKPEALLKRIILSCSKEDDTVIDLFGGSGTTAAAAAGLNRRFVTVDRASAATAVTRRRLIERCLKLRLYDAAKPMTLERDCAETAPIDVEKYFEIRDDYGRLSLRLRRLPAEARPYYTASGFLENGVFTATDYNIDPLPGDDIKLDPGRVLHIVDEDLEDHYIKVMKTEN